MDKEICEKLLDSSMKTNARLCEIMNNMERHMVEKNVLMQILINQMKLASASGK